MRYVLGIDGGGTKTTAVIAGAEGKVIAESTSGASNFLSVGVQRAIENLNRTISGAIENAGADSNMIFESSCFGFAGFNVPDDIKIYREIVGNNELTKHLNQNKLLIYNDTRIGLEAGSSAKDKIIIIAGTGSNCSGINHSGEEAGSNGWDYILSDEGSGYEVSVKALRAIMRAYDGRSEKTMLSGAVLGELGLDNETDIVSWIYGEPFSKERIGRFAKQVCKCAYGGDGISQKILYGEAMESVLSVVTVVERLRLSKKEFDLVFVGGLFKCEKYFKDIVMIKLKERFGGISFKPLVANPVEGAVKLAIDNL